MKRALPTIVALFSVALGTPGRAAEGDFSPMGEYLVQRQIKITGGGRVVEIPIKPLPLKVETDGVTVRVATGGAENDSWSTFTIYRSDGIGRQSTAGGPLEVVPGVQATSDAGGVHKHLRLTRDTLTLTVFPGVSDQTVITHAKLTIAPEGEAPSPPPAADALLETDDKP
jgi:hypothetical protein